MKCSKCGKSTRSMTHYRKCLGRPAAQLASLRQRRRVARAVARGAPAFRFHSVVSAPVNMDFYEPHEAEPEVRL